MGFASAGGLESNSEMKHGKSSTTLDKLLDVRTMGMLHLPLLLHSREGISMEELEQEGRRRHAGM
jgi:hypothetical protein